MAIVSDLLEVLGFPCELPQVSQDSSPGTGFVINSLERRIQLPEEKSSGIQKELSQAQHKVSARELAKFIGKLSAASLHAAPLHYRSVQEDTTYQCSRAKFGIQVFCKHKNMSSILL